MEPIFTDKQLNNMSREDLISLMKIVQEQTKKADISIVMKAVSRYLENQSRKVRPRTGCGYTSRMSSVAPRRWYSSIMKGPVRDIIL